MKHALALIAILAHFTYEIVFLAHLLMANFPFKISHPLFIHIFASSLAAILTLPFLKGRFHVPWVSLSFALSFLSLTLLPFFGSLLFLMALIYLIFVKKDEKIAFSTEDTEEEMYGFFEFEKPQKSEEELGEVLARALEIEPYIDILRGRDTELKKGALNKLSEIVTPNSVKIMRMALRDENPEVRLMASQALSKIEEKINSDVASASERVSQSPRSIEARNNLGALYYRYALLDIHDETTRRFHLQKALNEFLASLQENCDQEKILLLLGKIFLRIQNYQKAAEIFKKIIEFKPEELDPRIFLCNAYLGLKNFSSLQDECTYIKNNFKQNENTQELLGYWVRSI